MTQLGQLGVQRHGPTADRRDLEAAAQGRLVVDGGSVAGAALRAAVDEELALAEAKLNKQPTDGVAAGRCRQIAVGKPIAGTAFNVAGLAKTIAAAAARNAALGRRGS